MRMKPPRSVRTPAPSAQPVRGTPPRQRKRARAGAFSPLRTGNRDRARVSPRVYGLHLGSEAHVDRGRALDALDEIGRHGLTPRSSPRTSMIARAPWCARFRTAWPQSSRRRPRRPRRSRTWRSRSAPRRSRRRARAVIQTVNGQSAPLHPGRSQDHGSGQLDAPGKLDRRRPSGPSRLPTTPRRMISSAPKPSAWRPAMRASSAPRPARGSWKFLDQRRGRPGPGEVALDHDRRDSVGGRVNGGCQACRAGADDCELVVVEPRRIGGSPALGELLEGRADVNVVAVEDDRRGGSAARAPRMRSGLGRIRLQPSVRCAARVRRSRRAVVLRVEAPADHPDLRPDGAHATTLAARGGATVAVVQGRLFEWWSLTGLGLARRRWARHRDQASRSGLQGVKRPRAAVEESPSSAGASGSVVSRRPARTALTGVGPVAVLGLLGDALPDAFALLSLVPYFSAKASASCSRSNLQIQAGFWCFGSASSDVSARAARRSAFAACLAAFRVLLGLVRLTPARPRAGWPLPLPLPLPLPGFAPAGDEQESGERGCEQRHESKLHVIQTSKSRPCWERSLPALTPGRPGTCAPALDCQLRCDTMSVMAVAPGSESRRPSRRCVGDGGAALPGARRLDLRVLPSSSPLARGGRRTRSRRPI